MKRKNSSTKIFIVEDDPMSQKMAKHILELNPDHEVMIFETGADCLNNLQLKPDIISLDYTLPDMTGAEVLQKVKQFDSSIAVVILSSQQNIATAVQLLREGAYDYISKEEETRERLMKTVENIKKQQRLNQEVNELKAELQTSFSISNSIIGQSQSMQKVFGMLEKTKNTSITVSISGETGTGKEVIAKAIHYNSTRKKAPFVAVNMGAIPKELLESELFGHEKGAFTGANTRKLGLFELADKGTLFLDEICEMDINMQAKVLRVLQERELRRVGGEKMIAFDVRVVVASHKDMTEEVREGRFREDLFYRLMGLPIHLPPLRERENDIILLANHFLQQFAQKNKLENITLTRPAKNKLMAYAFPGNVRELKAVIELAAVMANNQEIVETDIQFNGLRKEANFLNAEMTFEGYKKAIIHHFLEKYNQDIGIVAEKLDIGKSTIYRMLQNSKTVLEN